MWNTNIQSWGCCVVAFIIVVWYFCPHKYKSLIFLDKWFVQIYLNVNSLPNHKFLRLWEQQFYKFSKLEAQELQLSFELDASCPSDV